MLNCVQTLDFGQQYERVQVVVGQDEFLKLCESLQFFKVCMVNDQIKSDIVQVHFLDLVVEFCSLKDLESVSIDVKDLVGLDLGMT